MLTEIFVSNINVYIRPWLYIPKTGILSISRFCSGTPYETTPSCSPRYMSLIKYLYDHGYIYRIPVYFLFLDSVVVCAY